MPPISEYLDIQNVPYDGIGLFANRAIDPSVLLSGEHPLTVKALSEARLKDSCSHCQASAGNAQGFAPPTSLKLCAGCKTVRYCSTKCQKASWATVHQLECRIFRKLAPRVLPSNVRAVMRLLLLSGAGKLRVGEWEEILALEDHLTDFREAGGQRWEDLILSAKAASLYSGTKVDEMTVVRLFGILMTNSFTMVSATFDPLGVALDPFAARMNHACEYNATVRFREGRFIDVVPLRSIGAGEEVTVSYVDEAMPVKERKEELGERYLFTCQCGKCVREEGTLAKPRSMNVQTAYNEAVSLLGSLHPDIKDLISTLRSLQKDGFTLTEYPMPSLRQTLITTYLSVNQYNHALIHALFQYLKLDPILYPVAHHPLRLVHVWLCVRIMDNIISSDTQAKDDLDLRPFSIDLDFLRHAVMLSLYRTVHLVPEGEFSRMVERCYEAGKGEWIVGNEVKFRSAEEATVVYQKQFTEETTLKTKWESVQRVIDEVLEKERR